MTFMDVSRRYTAQIMHWLPNVPDGHKCKRPHGHGYVIWVTIHGKTHPTLGWVMDYADIDAMVQPFIDMLEHHNVNDVVPNSTAENVCRWLALQITSKLEALDDGTYGNPRLRCVEVRETERSRATLTIPQNTFSPSRWLKESAGE